MTAALLYLALLTTLINPLFGASTTSRERITAALDGKVKNVVVLVLENRSFDHVLGLVDHPGMENLLGKTAMYSNQVDPSNVKSNRVYAGPGAPFKAPQDPGHEISSVTRQLFAQSVVKPPYPPANMQGFVNDAYTLYKNETLAGLVMKSFTPADLPIMAQLVKEFAVVDKWFASVPGPTQPNRAFIHSATSNGEVDNNALHMVLGYPQKTIYTAVKDAGLNFKIYYHDAPAALLFRELRRPSILLKNTSPYNPFLWYKGFKADAANGNLPPFSFIEPRYFNIPKTIFTNAHFANDGHPPHDVRYTQILVKEVYETLRNSPQWESTLLVVTFDEHGGYFDHVQPPSQGVPNPDGKVGDGILFDRLGVRVPTFLISPWIERGLVLHEPQGPTSTSQFEHSSIAATVKKIFGLPNFLTKRDAWAGTFEGALNLSSVRKDCPKQLVDAVPISAAGMQTMELSGPLTDMQEALVLAIQGMQKVEKMGTEEFDKESAGNYVRSEWEKMLNQMAETENHVIY